MKDMPVGVFNNVSLILRDKIKPSDEDLRYVVINSEVMRNQIAEKILNNPNSENDSIICVMEYCNKSLQEKAAEIFIEKNTAAKDTAPWCTALNDANNNSTREILWEKFDIANMSVEKLLIVLEKVIVKKYKIADLLFKHKLSEEALVRMVRVLDGEYGERVINLFCGENPSGANTIKMLRTVTDYRHNCSHSSKEKLVKMLLDAHPKDTDSIQYIMHEYPEHSINASIILINSRELTLYDLSFLMKHYKGNIIIKALSAIGNFSLDELKRIRPLIKFSDIKVSVKFIILTLMAILKISKTIPKVEKIAG